MPTVAEHIEQIEKHLQQGQGQQAFDQCQQGLQEHPGNVPLQTAQARVKWASGDAQGANNDFRALVQAHPYDPFVQLTYAGFLLANQFHQEAMVHAERAINEDPNLIGARLIYARAAYVMNRADLSIETLEKITPEQLTRPVDLINTGIIIHLLGDAARADKFFDKARPMYEAPEAFAHTLAVMSNANANYPLSLAAVAEFMDLTGDRQDTREMLAQAASLAGLPKAAAKAYEGMLVANPDHPEVRFNYAHYLMFTDGDIDTIINHVEPLLAQNRDNPQALEFMARMKAFKGEKAEAGELLARTIELTPDNLNLYPMLGSLVDLEDDHPAFDILEKRIAEINHAEVNSMLCKALARMYLHVGKTDRAFELIEEGNARAKEAAEASGLAYVPDHLEERLKEAKSLFTKEFRESVGDVGDKSELPLYIIGMPSTGGHTLNLMLSRHSKIASTGARFETSQAGGELERSRIGKKDSVTARYIKEHAARWRTRILDAFNRTVQESEKDARYVIDSYPNNLGAMGLTSMLLPKAKYIYIRREPLDLAMTIYSSSHQLGYNFATKLENIAHYMNAAETQVEAAREVLGDNLLEISYEDLIQDTRATLDKVLDFLGLEWEDDMAVWDDPKDDKLSLGRMQARVGLQEHGIGEGEKYKDRLKDFIDALSA